MPGVRERGEHDAESALTSRIQRTEPGQGEQPPGATRLPIRPGQFPIPRNDPRDALPQVLEAMDRSQSYTKPSPLPLPPSPAPVTGVKPWLAPGSLNAGAVPDLGAMTGESSPYTLPPVPELPMMSDDLDDLDGDEVPGMVTPPPAPAASWLDLQVRPWLFTALVAATCLAVGMVLGALIFGNPGSSPWSGEPEESSILQCPPSASSKSAAPAP